MISVGVNGRSRLLNIKPEILVLWVPDETLALTGPSAAAELIHTGLHYSDRWRGRAFLPIDDFADWRASLHDDREFGGG